MLLEALFAAAAEAVFSYILDTLEPAERLRDWLKRSPVKLAYQHALARTYAAFARQYPELTASLFNESFLTIEAAPELAKFLTRHQHPDHTQLVRLWAKSITPQTEVGQQSVEVLSKREDLNAASAYFVELLTSELKHESALQPLFDSRALESLPAIEAKLDQLTDALKQALTVATHYEQTVVNRSGGVDFQAQEVTIGGDLVRRDKITTNIDTGGGAYLAGDVNVGIGGEFVGRDKFVSNTYNTYFIGDFVTLDDLYIRPDAVFQRVRVQDFVGREWLTAKVDAFLNDEKRKSGVFLLVGEAGVGKTSFMAHLVTERRYLHLFAEQVPGDVNVSRALQSLGAQLVARYQIDPYKEKGTLPAIATFPDFLDKLLRLAADRLSAGEKIIIVCDALDEAGTSPNGNVFGLPSVLPDGVYFILSQRPVATVKLSVKANLVKETIDATGADNLHDVEQYLAAVSRRPEVSNQLRAHNYAEADFVRILKERSGGVWMYLFYVVGEIGTGSRAPLDLATLPSGLAGYYTDYWGDWSEGRSGRGDGPAKWDAAYAPLLATLAAAQLPISLKLLLAWSHVLASEYEVERLLRRNWRAFISERELEHTPHFSLHHASLRDFLTGQVDRQGLTLEADQLINELVRRTYDAHACIIDYYRQRCNDDWVKLVDDDYARTYLCLHLSASGDDEAMYQLVAMNNAWAKTKYAKEETYAGYLVDLNRAWQYAETEAHWNIGHQIRCALIESSIHSLASNISPKLLGLLIETNLWSSTRALAHTAQISDERHRVESLEEIAPYLSHDLKAEALAIARAISGDHFRVRALSGLAPHLPDGLKADAVRNALATARAIKNQSARAEALSGLAPHLPDGLKAEALATARAISDDSYRAVALSSFVPHLPDNLKAEVVRETLAATRVITRDHFRVAFVLSGLTPYLPEGLKADAVRDSLAAARAITDDGTRARALSYVAPNLPDDLKADTVRDALATIRAITDDRSGVINHDYDRAEALVSLAPQLPDDLKAGALITARTITDENARARALSGLVSYLPNDLKFNALAAARAITYNIARIRALSGLVPYLPDDLKKNAVRDALAAARAVTDDSARAYALSDVAPHLPGDLKGDVVRDAHFALQAIPDYNARANALCSLAPHLPDDLKADALSAARAIKNQNARAKALSGLAPHLSGDLKAEVIRETLDAAYNIADDYNRARALSSLAPHLSDDLRAEVLFSVHAISNDHARAEALSNLAPNLPSALKADALAAARLITDDSARAHALSGLAPHLPDDLKAAALAAARAITDNSARARALSGLVPYLPDDLKANAVRDALAAARTRVLSDLVPHLPNGFLKVAARTQAGDCNRAEALVSLAPYLTDNLKAVALATARAITDDSARARALSGLASHLPDDLKAEALAVARAITDNSARVRALSGLVPYLPDDLKAEVVCEALAAARSIRTNVSRAFALSGLAPNLPGDLGPAILIEAFILAHSVSLYLQRCGVYEEVISTWQEMHFVNFKTSMWKDALHSLARHPRKDLLGDLAALAPLIEHLGGQSAMEEFFYALRDVTTWWP